MKLLIYILPFLAFAQDFDGCNYILTDSINVSFLDFQCSDVYMDEYSVIVADSIRGTGRIMFGRLFVADTVNEFIVVTRHREYKTPLYTKTRPKIYCNKIDDSLKISPLIVLE